MLVHTSAIQKEHFIVYDEIQKWLIQKDQVIECCRTVYADEAYAITKADLQEANPDYGLLSSIREDMPAFEELLTELHVLLSGITNILLGEDKSLEYSSGLHLCVDNCSANREAEEGTYLRIVYPTDEQLKAMEKAPAFLVIGGNTLSRGLTIDGLVCTYFSRTSNQADTLMQMARWFGYRKGYLMIIKKIDEMGYLVPTLDGTNLEVGSISQAMYYFYAGCDPALKTESIDVLQKTIRINIERMLKGGGSE